uniref:Uncharacterized protein n=1 Tax=Clastoptera arizonana TaxID=38151 RepID=A0A1B6CSX1_9HEMI
MWRILIFVVCVLYTIQQADSQALNGYINPIFVTGDRRSKALYNDYLYRGVNRPGYDYDNYLYNYRQQPTYDYQYRPMSDYDDYYRRYQNIRDYPQYVQNIRYVSSTMRPPIDQQMVNMPISRSPTIATSANM